MLFIGGEDHGHQQVVVQVRADPRQVCEHRHADLLEVLTRPDAGAKQDLRAADRPGTQHHPLGPQLADLAVLLQLHPDGAPAVEDQPAYHGPGNKDQPILFHHRTQVGMPGVEPLAVPDGQLHPRHPLGIPAVVVGVQRESGLLGRYDHRLLDRIALEVPSHVQQSLSSTGLARPTVEGLDLPEIRQDVLPSPPGASGIGPGVVVLASAAHPDSGVQGVGTAHDLPARQVQPPPVGARLGRGLEVPVLCAVPDPSQVPEVGDVRIGVLRTGFHEGDGVTCVEQTTGQDVAGAARADDQVLGLHRPVLSPVMPRSPSGASTRPREWSGGLSR
ncbi:Uncharacterised protein [Rothia kristinae]|nr:Uncharacterised protein [Rothia kristinae]